MLPPATKAGLESKENLRADVVMQESGNTSVNQDDLA
jgi:hypothetical protein